MRADIAFSADDSHRFLPWLIGMMVVLAALLLCFVVTINGWVIDKNSSYSNNITVNIPASNGERTPSDAAVAKVIDLLQKSSGVKSVSRIEQARLQKMLVPWLGETMANADLPLPAVLEVELKDGVSVDAEKLQEAIAQIATGAEVDTHEAWVSAFIKFSATIRAVITMFSVLIVIAIALMIAFTSRASLHLHSRAVRLLHSMGAEDRYIARQFQQEASAITLRGAGYGSFLAAISFFAMDHYIKSLGNASIPSLSMGMVHIYLLVGLVVLCALVAWLTSRYAVMQQLRQTL